MSEDISATDCIALYDRLKAKLLKPTPRKCGGCQACCKIIPVEELGKKAHQRCRYQRHGKGCSIYAKRPLSCAGWNCAWLEGFPFPRPDNAHYVVDGQLDVIGVEHPPAPDGMVMVDYYDVLQVWLDPAYPEAWRCDQLGKFLDARRMAAIVRLDERMAFTLWPPSITEDGTWHQTPAKEANKERYQVQAERAAREGR